MSYCVGIVGQQGVQYMFLCSADSESQYNLSN